MSSPKCLISKAFALFFLLVGCQVDQDITLGAFSQPSIPENLSVSKVTSNSLLLEWSPASEEEAITNYLVYQNDLQVAYDSIHSYYGTELNAESEYSYKIRAINVAGKISEFSSEVTVQTKADQVVTPDPDPDPNPDPDPDPDSNKVLIFSKTVDYRHPSIEKGLALFTTLGENNDFEVVQTEDATDFNSVNLSGFKVVVFLNTSGDVLNADQQTAFEKYIQSGGSFMGVHSATNTELEWPWYGQLVGAYYKDHPGNVQEASMNVIDRNHQATEHLEATWTRTDEWYNFINVNDNIEVLLNIDETSMEGGDMGENHPAAWYHEFDGGRSFYTAGGHGDSAYTEPDFQKHLLGGVLYCLGR